MTKHLWTALLALALSSALPISSAAAQWVRGTGSANVRVTVRAPAPPPPPSVGVVVVATAPAPAVTPDKSPAPAVRNDPAPTAATPAAPVECTAWWAVGGAPGGGISIGLNGVLVDEQALFGARLAANISLVEHLNLDFGFNMGYGGEDQERVEDYVLSTGVHAFLNPRSSTRVFIPVAAGFAFHGTGPVEGDKSWGTHFMANTGLGLQVHLTGPIFFETSVRAELRQRLDVNETRIVGVADLGIALLF